MANEIAEETATCRGCGMALKGKPYWAGQGAYHPVTGDTCKVNFFGGFVCSEDCDRRASLEMLGSMPGAGPARQLNGPALESFNRNWR